MFFSLFANIYSSNKDKEEKAKYIRPIKTETHKFMVKLVNVYGEVCSFSSAKS